MKLNLIREQLLTPLQLVSGAVERRQTKPILSNILLDSTGDEIILTATDLEVELSSTINIKDVDKGKITVPARKLLDICRNLDPQANIKLSSEKTKVILKTGKSRFILSSLNAEEFPLVGDLETSRTIRIPQKELKLLVDKTAFAMAQQDVRYYLNGMLLEVGNKNISTVATDGHRLALCKLSKENTDTLDRKQVIIPRKGVMELQKLLISEEKELQIKITNNHVRVELDDIVFTSKLIDGRFPSYERVIPEEANQVITVDKELFRQVLTRVSILSNEKYRGIRMFVNKGHMKIQAHNPENEEAEEELEVDYNGNDLEMGFNVNYLLDVISVIDSQTMEINTKDSESSVLIRPTLENGSTYVVMPMRL